MQNSSIFIASSNNLKNKFLTVRVIFFIFEEKAYNIWYKKFFIPNMKFCRVIQQYFEFFTKYSFESKENENINETKEVSINFSILSEQVIPVINPGEDEYDFISNYSQKKSIDEIVNLPELKEEFLVIEIHIINKAKSAKNQKQTFAVINKKYQPLLLD